MDPATATPTADEAPARSAFDAYVAPARARPEFWRILVGLLLIVLCFVGWQIVVLLAAVLPMMIRSGGDTAAINGFLTSVMQLSTPTGVFVALGLFAGLWGGAALAAFALHRRGLRTLIAAPGRPLLAGAGTGMLLALVAMAASFALTMPGGAAPARSAISLAEWLPMVAILLPLVLIQTGAEELVFRGYLLQQLAARFRSPLVWGVLPSLAFGAMHWWNVNEGPLASLLYVSATACFGFAAAAMVWRTGGLAAAMGFHAVVNFMSLSLFGLEDSYDGLSLYVVPKGDVTGGLAVDTAVMAGVAALVLSRWSPFRRRR